MKKSCAIFTSIAPLYSRCLWYELSESGNTDYSFYSSAKGFSGIKTLDINESEFLNEKGKIKWYFIKNIYLRNILIFQLGIISRCLKTDYDVYILSGEMHTMSNWLAALVCKMRGKPVILWGHGLYGNEKFFKRKIRLLYYKIADAHLVYSGRSRELLIKSGFHPKSIHVVYNSLDYKLHNKFYNERNQVELEKLRTKFFPLNSHLPVIIFIGRLTKEKKLNYLLGAIKLSKYKGNIYNCLILGEGREMNKLRDMAVSLGINDLVYFFGSSYDEKMNANSIMLAECCVSPGNAGLTAIHSLSFGTPVITHNNLSNQMPEVEAVIPEKTGMFFGEDDIENLSEVIDDFILNRKKSIMESACRKQVEEFWNPVKQRSVFDKAVAEV